MKSVVLLDRSGSMGRRWSDVAGTLQHYFDNLTERATKTTLCAFDTEGFDEVWRNVPASELGSVDTRLQDARISPRSGTPLLDSIGKLGKVVDEVGKNRVQIVILTDGQENASREITKAAAEGIIKGWRDRNYDVVFLGADWDAFAEAQSLGVYKGSTLNYNTRNSGAVGQSLATRAAAYADGQDAATMDWSDADREAATK